MVQRGSRRKRRPGQPWAQYAALWLGRLHLCGRGRQDIFFFLGEKMGLGRSVYFKVKLLQKNLMVKKIQA